MRRGALVGGLTGLLVAGVPAAGVDFRDVKERGALRVLCIVEPDAASFFSLASDRPGFDHELLLGFARLHQVELQPVAVESRELLLPALLAGHGDLVAGPLRAPGTDDGAVAFTMPVLPAAGSAEGGEGGALTSLAPEIEKPLERAMALERMLAARPAAPPLGPAASSAPHGLGYVLRAQDQALLTALNDYLFNVRHTATWSQLLIKYFGDGAETEQARGE